MSKGIRFKKNNENAFVDKYYRVGDLYSTTSNDNPSILFGGTWEKIKSFSGGELVAMGAIYYGKTNTVYDGTMKIKPSDLDNKTYYISNIIDGILKFDSGTFRLYTLGVVGVVDVSLTISGYGSGSSHGIWWLEENANTLPTTVQLWKNNSTNAHGPLTAGIASNTYGAGSNNYVYECTKGTSTNFYINPQFVAYPGAAGLTIGNGGVGSQMIVKVYAAGGINNVWKRTA